MEKTLTFDIQRFSLQDGPGIRTVVFLKGCPLRCKWCHNPESGSPNPELSFIAEKCVHCMACVDACPTGAQQNLSGRHAFDRNLCNACGACGDVCPSGALKLYGRDLSVDEIMHEVIRDKAYYEDSGGGLTISGGEPMMHPEFVEQLLTRARREGLSTCLDTSGCAPWSRYERILPLVDIWHYDYKASPERSRALTGLSETKARQTLERLYDRCPESIFILRCPMIPNINDDEQHLKNIAQLCQSMPRLQLDILPWHNMGMGKSLSLGKKTPGGLPQNNSDNSYKASILEKLKAWMNRPAPICYGSADMRLKQHQLQ